MKGMEKALEAASALDDEGGDDMDAEDDEYSEDSEHKAAFMDMCKAMKAGKFEEAWEHYQACRELE